MADIQSYERILKRKNEGEQLLSKILMIFIYLVIISVFFVVAVRYGLSPALIVLLPLVLLSAVLLTWKYTSVEFEYSFVAGTFTFSKIYGKRRRRTVLEADIKKMISVSAYNEQKQASLGKEGAGTIINGIPNKLSQNPCVCVFEADKNEKIYFLFECDELSARIFKFFNSAATDRSIFDRLTKGE